MPDQSRSHQSRSGRFEAVVLPHLDAAYNLARWLTGTPADAEDAVQEAFVKALRYFDSCRGGNARPWFLRIVRNACFDWLKANRGGANGDDANGEDVAEDVFSGPAPDPECLLARDEERRLVDDLIAALPAGYREVIVLRELEELSYREIAEVTGTPIGTVMSRLSRARGLLHEAWRQRHGTD